MTPMNFVKLLKKVFGLETVKAVGVDIGAQYIKIAIADVQRRGDKEKIIIRDLGYTETVPLTEKEELASKLRQLFAEHKIDPDNYKLVVSISGSQIIVRPIRIEKVSPKDLEVKIIEEAEKYIPYKIEEVNIAHAILEESLPDDPDKMEVLLVAAPLDLIKDIEEIISLTYIPQEAIEVDSIAIYRLLDKIKPPKFSEGTIAVLDIGAYSVGITIYYNGKLKHARVLNIGSALLTNKIVENMGMSFKDGEEYKRKYLKFKVEGEDLTSEEAKVFTTVKDIVDKLVTELRRSFLFYKTRYKGTNIEKILLTGGGSLAKNLDKYLESKLKVPVQVFNPLEKAQLPKKLKNKISNEEGVLFSVALGLALREIHHA